MQREAVIAVNRFGLGAAPGELAAAASDPRAWLAVQIAQPAPLAPEFAEAPPVGRALKEYPRWIASLGQARGGAGLRDAGRGRSPPAQDRGERSASTWGRS